MEVRFLKEHEIKLSGTISRRFPAGWSGEIGDVEAAELARDGIVEALAPAAGSPPPLAQQFNAAQASVLAAAADEILSQAAAAQVNASDALALDEPEVHIVPSTASGKKKR